MTTTTATPALWSLLDEGLPMLSAETGSRIIVACVDGGEALGYFDDDPGHELFPIYKTSRPGRVRTF